MLLQITTNVFSGVDELKKKVVDLAGEYGMKLVVAIIILVVGFFVVRWLGRLVERWLEKQPLEPPLRSLLVRVVRLLLMLGVVFAAIENMGFHSTAILAGIGVAGIGVGLALQGVLSNVVAGLTIIFTKPFRVGEYVEMLGVQGQVQAVELFSTTLLHPDMSRVVIPNRKIVGEILHNYGNIRQLSLVVGVAYGTNLVEAMGEIRQILDANTRVLKEPAPGIGIASLADSSINVAVKPWTTVADFGPAGTEIYQAIADRFRSRGISIPFPQREVRLLEKG